MGWEVLLFVPNIIGYVRIILASAAMFMFHTPLVCSVLYGVSISLDAIDGYAARKLKQTSVFGAWFDVVIDNYSRGLLWCALFKWGYLIIFIEWITFVSTHSRGSDWKIPEESFPTIVKLVMSNGFKSPMGMFAVGSLHLLPLWLYMYEFGVLENSLLLPHTAVYTGIALLTVGRTVCFSVELFYIYQYIRHLAEEHSQ